MSRPNRWSVVVTTPPDELPVTRIEAKQHLVIDLDDDDEYLDALAKAGTEQAQKFTDRYFMPQTVTLYLDRWPDHGFALMANPIRTVDAVRYVDADGAPQTLDPAKYETDLNVINGWIQPVDGESWPAVAAQLNAIEIDMSVGYEDMTKVPQGIKHGIMLWMGHLYEHRELTITTSINMVPASEALLEGYKVGNL